MTGEQLAWWMGTRAVVIVIGLYLLHRLALRLEAAGHIYYWHNQPTGGGVKAAAWELDRLTRPSAEYHIAAEDEPIESEENDGE